MVREIKTLGDARETKCKEPTFDSQGYKIHTWMQTEILSTIAHVGHVELTHATCAAALGLYPGRRMALQQRALVLKDSRFRVLKGGKA